MKTKMVSVFFPILLATTLCGCDRDDNLIYYQSRSPDAPARVSRTPVVLDDSDEIQRCREIFENELAELYQQAINNISQGEWIFSEHEFALQQRKQQAVADLSALLDDESLPAKGRTKAAEQLILLGDTRGEKFLFNSLDSDSKELRLAALKSLREWNLDLDFSSPERNSILLAQLEAADHEIILAAAELCNYRKIPGTENRLTTLLEAGKLTDPKPVAMELAEIASTQRAVKALLPHVLRDKPEEFSQWTGYAFEQLIENPDPEISGPVKQALYDYTLQFPEQRNDQILVECLAKTANKAAIPVLKEILKNAKDPVSRTYAIGALARLQPDQALDLLTSHIKQEGPGYSTIRLLQTYATEQDYDQIIPVIEEWTQKSEDVLDTEVLRLCLLKFGNRGEQFVREHLDQLTDQARMRARWKLEGLNLHSALKELHISGVIQTSPDELIKKINEAGNRSKDTDLFDPSNPDSLYSALVLEGIVVMFDAETSTIPCRHDRLILDFANASKGKFTPQWPVEYWHSKNEEDFDAPYTVQFVLENRLYRTGAENYGDWYDVEAIVRLINFALETTGRPERFITEQSGGQIASFIFADPFTFVPIARRYGLPLSTDPAEAMRKGLEFEERVINQLRENED